VSARAFRISRRTFAWLAGLCCLFLFGIGASHGQKPAQDASEIRHVIIVSIDGLMPATYTDPDARGLKVPTLRFLAKNGAISSGARSVMPTLTYPAHTSIATGAHPAKHGIVTNAAWDPMGRNQDGWRWYSEDIRVPTLWQVAKAKGLRTALVNWPVTVGANVDFLLPEYWRASNKEDLKLTRALATRGLLDAVAKRHPDFYDRYTPPNVKDSIGADVATYIIETKRPHLLMLHIFEVDHWQHEKGPWSPEAKTAIENADAQLARIVAAAKSSGIWNQTALVVVSDHGFRSYTQRIRPGVLLREKGLISLDDRNRITDWKAVVVQASGTAFFYLKDKKDEATRSALLSTFTSLAGKPGSGISRMLLPEDIAALGGDHEAVLAIESAEGFAFSSGYTGDLIFPTSANSVAGHGWPPDRPEMLASMILYGPGIAPGKIEDARLIDVAPTVASWLDLKMAQADGAGLPVRGRARP
jgi:predicted AlkP superfamily pyrophosphatase or phosphodiesterase